MTRTRWIVFALVCVLTLGGLVLFSKKDAVNVDDLNAAQPINATDEALGDQVYGKKDSKVVLIEYGDFQCPGCGGAYAQVKAIKEEYKDQIAFVYRHFPLTTIHPNALAAATAAEAAGLQGKFWEMHDKLFEMQNTWGNVDPSQRTEIFAQYAMQIGLMVDPFKNDLSNPKIASKISRDRALGNKLGVSSTPTFFLGEEKLTDEEVSDIVQKDGSLIRKKLDEALKKNGIALPAKPAATEESQQ